MPKKKLVHFQENLTFPHLFQPSYAEIASGFSLFSKWGSDFFFNSNPIVLELGCGKGEYTVGLAGRYPLINFIGIDLKGARLWRGARTVQEKSMKNVAFIRTRVDQINNLFCPGEIAEIWITFPDPQKGKERKRLTAPVFLNRYHKILNINGLIHLKTDDEGLYNYTMGILADYGHTVLYHTTDLYNSDCCDDVVSIRTFYENKWLEEGKKICYIRFKLNF